jgi:endogenous inhibitor of DNA gyrase (YacG/DUF329 family)
MADRPTNGSAPSKTAACPICGKPSVPESRPFCSRRCADVDLHRWLSGRYAIPVREESDEDGVPALDGPPVDEMDDH